MSTDKRERQRAGREARVIAEQKATKRVNIRRTVVRVVVIAVVVLGGLFAWTALTGNDDNATTETAGEDAATQEVTTTLADPGTPVEPTCPASDGSSPRQVNFSRPPPTCIDPAKTYTANIQTTRGDFEITLDASKAPKAVNNFVFLSRWHYYEGVGFHRIIPGFVVQGGDAVGPEPGSGGPGYQFADELPTEGPPYYPLMSVAMANSGANTNGSQFFLVTGEQGSQLPAQYSLFGNVTAGDDVVREIETTGSESGTPSELTVIEQVTIAES